MNAMTAAAAAPGKAKGPLVWLDMDQQALDDAYDQAVYAPNRDRVVAPPSRGERAGAGCSRASRSASLMGRATIEELDIYRSSAPNAPVKIFIHGGAWRRNKAADYALQAEPFVRAGGHAVIVDFINVEQAGGDLLPMVRAGVPRDRLDLAQCGRNSAAIATGFTFRRIRRARIWPVAR